MNDGEVDKPRLSSRPPPPGSSLRILFGVAWIALQAVLILTAGRRPDGAFGFRMFPESSTIKIALFRELGHGERVHVERGAWSAGDANGFVRRFDWHDRVKEPHLGVFDVEIPASYGSATQLARLDAALDDISRHVPDDNDTRRFLLEVTIRRNGREPYTVHLAGPDRYDLRRPHGGF